MAEGAYQTTVAAANACADACDHCLSQCLLEQDVTAMARCIALDLECAAICRELAGFAVRGSKFAPRLAEVAAEIARACGDECGRHPHDHCQQCAVACRQAVEAFRSLQSIGVDPPAGAAP